MRELYWLRSALWAGRVGWNSARRGLGRLGRSNAMDGPMVRSESLRRLILLVYW